MTPRRRLSDKLAVWKAVFAVVAGVGAVIGGMVTAPTFVYEQFVQPKVAKQIECATRPIEKELTYLNCMFAVTLSDEQLQKANGMYKQITRAEQNIEKTKGK